MFVYIIAIIFFIVIFSTLFCCLACISCLGLTSSIKNIITKYSSTSFDRQYIANQDNQPINSQCFICLQRIKCQVVATCNHSFCASCINSYIDSQNQVIKCPACRKQVCVLFRKFNPRTAEQRHLKQKICQYNFKHAQQPSLLRSILQIGTFIRQIPRLFTVQGLNYLLTNPRVKVILLMILYTLSPIDILPQALLGPIGLVDDGFVLANIARQFTGLMVNFVGQEGMRDREEQRRQN